MTHIKQTYQLGSIFKNLLSVVIFTVELLQKSFALVCKNERGKNRLVKLANLKDIVIFNYNPSRQVIASKQQNQLGVGLNGKFC